jgi:RNA polymerase sigma factor (sigma-70 family)
MTREWSDRELYEACGEEGSDQQRQVFALLYVEFYSIALFMVQSAATPDPQELAQDCAQEALIKVWKNLATCTQPATFRHWAKTILRNQTLNELAKLKRKREDSLDHDWESPLPEPHSNPAVAVARAEKYTALLDLLAAAPISERSRFVILAKYLAQMSEEEISQTLSAKEQGDVRPSHVQVTRAKNFKKLYSDAELRRQFADLQDSDADP